MKYLPKVTASLLAIAAAAPAYADSDDKRLLDLIQKQNAQIEVLKAQMQRLEDRLGPDRSIPAADNPTIPVASRPSPPPEPQTPPGEPALIAPTVVYAGLVPDIGLGKVVLRFHGDVVAEVGATRQDNDINLRSTAARERFRLILNPDVQVGDGWSYGGLVRYVVAKADQTVNAPDRAFVYARGPYGDFSAGVRNGYGDESYFPWAMGYLPTGRFDTALGFMVASGGTTGGVQTTDPISGRYLGPDLAGGVIGALNSTALVWPALNADNSATKLMYVSPRVAGFRLGADWTPRNDAFNIGTNRLTVVTSPTTGVTSSFQNLVEVGTDYDRTFSGVRVLGNLVYNFGKATRTTVATDEYRDLKAIQAGLRLEYAGFAVGASLLDFRKSGQQTNSTLTNPRFNERTYNYALEAQYAAGRWVVGGVYRYGQDPGLMNVPGIRDVRIYEVGVGYTVWAGLQLQFQLDHFAAQSDKPTTPTSGSPDDRGNVLTTRAVFRF